MSGYQRLDAVIEQVQDVTEQGGSNSELGMVEFGDECE